MQRTLYPEVKIADPKAGISEYIASDESIDSDGEVIRASGWKFDRMEKNAPFVNCHNYRDIKNLLGKVLGGRVENGRLVETVQWAIDVPENDLARIGWAMTLAGYLKAVSVGFLPQKLATRLAPDDWPSDWDGALIANAAMREGKKVWQAQLEAWPEGTRVPFTFYLEQQQTELSSCIVGANANAVGKSIKEFAHAHKAGVLSDADLEILSTEYANVKTVGAPNGLADDAPARQQARRKFMWELERTIKRL